MYLSQLYNVIVYNHGVNFQYTNGNDSPLTSSKVRASAIAYYCVNFIILWSKILKDNLIYVLTLSSYDYHRCAIGIAVQGQSRCGVLWYLVFSKSNLLDQHDVGLLLFDAAVSDSHVQEDDLASACYHTLESEVVFPSQDCPAVHTSKKHRLQQQKSCNLSFFFGWY